MYNEKHVYNDKDIEYISSYAVDLAVEWIENVDCDEDAVIKYLNRGAFKILNNQTTEEELENEKYILLGKLAYLGNGNNRRIIMDSEYSDLMRFIKNTTQQEALDNNAPHV